MKALIAMLMLFATLAFAGTERELKNLLQGKTAVFEGVCLITNGLLTTEDQEGELYDCVVGEDDEAHYVLILDGNKKPVSLILVNTDGQKILWKKGLEV